MIDLLASLFYWTLIVAGTVSLGLLIFALVLYFHEAPSREMPAELKRIAQLGAVEPHHERRTRRASPVSHLRQERRP